jgi:hypothetical protein
MTKWCYSGISYRIKSFCCEKKELHLVLVALNENTGFSAPNEVSPPESIYFVFDCPFCEVRYSLAYGACSGTLSGRLADGTF